MFFCIKVFAGITWTMIKWVVAEGKFPQERDRVSSKINPYWLLWNKIHLLPKISISTLNAYTNIIFVQCVFNIKKSLKHKTGSQETTEWSKCSTICYIIAVATFWFCHGWFRLYLSCPLLSKPKRNTRRFITVVNKLKIKELNARSNKGTKFLPVLPSLLTSIDIVTIFCHRLPYQQ